MLFNDEWDVVVMEEIVETEIEVVVDGRFERVCVGPVSAL